MTNPLEISSHSRHPGDRQGRKSSSGTLDLIVRLGYLLGGIVGTIAFLVSVLLR
jgi:hypothetical protein